jgi:anti-sigma B factor antagonist
MSYSGHHRSHDDTCSPGARESEVWASRDPRAAISGEEPVPMTELNLSVRHYGDHATIQVGGEIDLATGPQLQAVLVELVDRGCHQLIVDLERVSFLDCAGIRVLVDALRRVQEHGGSLKLVRPRPLVWRVLTLTGMTTVFPIHTSLGEPLATEPVRP